MRRECKQGGRGLREAPGLSQTWEAPDGPSKLMRIKEKIFLRFAVFTLHQGVRGEAADQTGGPNPAKSHVQEFFLNFDLIRDVTKYVFNQIENLWVALRNQYFYINLSGIVFRPPTGKCFAVLRKHFAECFGVVPVF